MPRFAFIDKVQAKVPFLFPRRAAAAADTPRAPSAQPKKGLRLKFKWGKAARRVEPATSIAAAAVELASEAESVAASEVRVRSPAC